MPNNIGLPAYITQGIYSFCLLQSQLSSSDRLCLFALYDKYLTAYLSRYVSRHIPSESFIHAKHILANELNLINQKLIESNQVIRINFVVNDLGSGKFSVTWQIFPQIDFYTINFAVCDMTELDVLFSKLN